MDNLKANHFFRASIIKMYVGQPTALSENEQTATFFDFIRLLPFFGNSRNPVIKANCGLQIALFGFYARRPFLFGFGTGFAIALCMNKFLNHKMLCCFSQVIVNSFFVTMIVFSTVSSFAKEGFSDANDLSENIWKAQDSVFLFLYDDGGKYSMGTAYIIQEDADYFYFATNNHVIKGRCESDGSCPKVKLYQAGFFLPAASGTGFKFSSDWPHLSDVKVFDHYENPDYAILRANKKPNTPFLENRKPAPLKISKTPLKIGDKVYTVGFPNVFSRTCTGHLPIKNQDSIYKRGSEGIYVGRFKSDDNADANTHTWIGTTIDALGGNSGGPILNELGEVVGTMQKSASEGDGKGNCYSGNEEPGNLDWESLAIPYSQAL